MEENDIMYKTCPICGKDMILIDHDDADGLFAGWEWQCQICDYKEKEEN